MSHQEFYLKMSFTIKLILFILGCCFITSQCASNGNEEMFKYRTYEEINDYLDKVQTKHKDKVSRFTIGHSVENRPINCIKISNYIRNNSVANKAVLIDAGIHAREWVAPVVALYAIHQLVENELYSNLTDSLDWYILPMLNPDGYIYSMDPNGDRLWRKNRSPTPIPDCQGVDLNRNFEFFWGGLGSSNNPCNLSYRGPQPFSEPESLAFAKFVMSVKNQVKLYLTLHSAAQAIIYPWGYADEVPPDWMDLENLAIKAEKAIASFNGTRYMIGSTTSVVGVGAGGSDDWAKGIANIKYVYTVELPGLQYPHDGFHAPKEELPRIAKETFEGIKAFAEEV